MIVAAFLTVIVLASCSPSKPAPQITIPHWILRRPELFPYFVMQEKGFSKAEQASIRGDIISGGGLRSLRPWRPGLWTLVSVVQFPYFWPVSVGSSLRKLFPWLQAVLLTPTIPALGVLVASAIKSWKDLEGKQIAINARNSLLDAAIRGRLQKEGVQNYKLIEISFSNMGLAVAGGNIAAAIMVRALPYSITAPEGWETAGLDRWRGAL